MTHFGMPSLLESRRTALGVNSGWRVLLFGSLTIDGASADLFMALSTGAVLVLLRAEQRVGSELLGVLEQNRISFATIPPSVLASTGRACEPYPECLVVAGEDCPEPVVAEWSVGRRMINEYGPTESTVTATYSAVLSGSGPAPLGRPVWNTRIYVLDPGLQPVPVGVAGELYIAGAGLARGI